MAIKSAEEWDEIYWGLRRATPGQGHALGWLNFLRAIQADALESAAEIAAITVFHVRNADGTIMTKAEAIRALKPPVTS